MWRTYAQRAGRPPADGTAVYAFGRPTLYEGKGDFQFLVQRMLPTAAVGDQQLRLERVKAALAADGLFDVARKRPLPRCPERVALVTSTDGAALRDIVTVAGKRWPSATLLVVASRVQGEGAARDLVAALRLVNRLDVDLCIVGGVAATSSISPRSTTKRSAVRSLRCGSRRFPPSGTRPTCRSPISSPTCAQPPPRRRRSSRSPMWWTSGGRCTSSVGAARPEPRPARRAARGAARAGRRSAGGSGGPAALGRASPWRPSRRRARCAEPLARARAGYAVPRDASGRVLRRRAEFAPGARSRCA